MIGTSEAPFMVVSTGKIVSVLTFMPSNIERGITVSWAPVSHIEGLLVVLPGLLADCLSLGMLSPNSA